MAITWADVSIWRGLKAAGLIPIRPSLLEIGQSNWYGDVDPQSIVDDMCAAGIPWEETGKERPFEEAANFYKLMFAPVRTVAIDLHGQPDALKIDLNGHVWSDGLDDKGYYDHGAFRMDFVGGFDIIVNTGTTEHIFDQRRVFETIHDACTVGGLMLHGVPWKGWMDHGFYCYQPTFFVDLATANGYEILVMAGFQLGTMHLYNFKSLAAIHALEKAKRLPAEMMLYCVMRKTHAGPFIIPQQGVYNDAAPVGEDLKRDWKSMREA